eukprot:4595043-Pyramimonas_sp.AAC.1
MQTSRLERLCQIYTPSPAQPGGLGPNNSGCHLHHGGLLPGTAALAVYYNYAGTSCHARVIKRNSPRQLRRRVRFETNRAAP